MEITVGAGLKFPRGARVQVADVAELARALAVHPDENEGWWAPHTWKNDSRDSDAWESSSCIGIDLDREGHVDLVGEIAERLEAAAQSGGLSGSIFHRTPAGARIVFALDKACTNAADFIAAAEGAAQAVAADLVELSIEGVTVDPKPHRDLARLYFLPNTFAKGRQRKADIITLRSDLYRAEDLAELRKAVVQAQATVTKLPLPATSNVRRAAAYIATMGVSVEGNHGDDLGFKVAATLVRDFALDDGEAWSLLSNWNQGCQPPWPDSDLKRFLSSAQRNGKAPVGQKLLEQRPPPPAAQRRSPVTSGEVVVTSSTIGMDVGGIKLVRACEVGEEKVEWLIPNFVARRELTDLSGDPGVGKGGIIASWSAAVTTSSSESVLLFATEDRLGHVKARLRAEGADLNRIYLLDIREANTSPILPGDIDNVEALVKQARAGLVAFDPALEFMAAGLDSHKQQDVQLFAAALGGMAQRTGAAVLTVRHLNKGQGVSAIYKSAGSIAFVARARMALLASKDKESGRRVLAVVKGNIGKDTHAMTFDIVEHNDSTVVAWGEQSTMTADELVNQDPTKKRHGPAPAKVEAVTDLLRSLLSTGPMKVDEILRTAKHEGISRSRVYVAKREMKLQSCTIELASGWRLPE